MLVRPQRIQVKIAIPFVGEISGEWEPDDAERKASWELYVELVTRIAVVPLPKEQGSLRESMTSMYSLFGITRGILRRYGPQVAPAGEDGAISFGSLAVTVLNSALRPFLTKWHPLLETWEASRPTDRSPVEHEQVWPHTSEMRADLDRVRLTLGETARVLGAVAGAADLIGPTTPESPG